MNLKLRVKKTENQKISASLIKQMCELKCRISIDLESGSILVEGINDEKVGDVISAVDETFEVIGVDIIPAKEVEEVSIEETAEVSTSENEETEVTADSYEVKKIHFENEEIENRIEKLLKTIAWAMSTKNANEKDIVKYILSIISEIHFRYDAEKHTDFSVGDIVDCNFGARVKGEISGGHVHALVCNIDNDGSVYVVPITKGVHDYDEKVHISFSAPKDAEYNDSKFFGGVLLLNKATNIFHGRINSVVGYVKPELFDKVLVELPKVVDFHEKNENYEEQLNVRLGNVDNEDDSFGTQEEEQLSEEVTPENTEETAEDSISDKKTAVASYLQQRFSEAFNEMHLFDSIYQKICVFWNKIDFQPYDSDILEIAFEAASSSVCTPKYSIIVDYIKEKRDGETYENPISESEIKEILKRNFKVWIEKYPDLKEKYPRINLMHLLTAFSENLKKSKN